MSDSELSAAGRLAFAELGKATVGVARMHAAIADRVFRLTGPACVPVKSVHDRISAGVYQAIVASTTLLGSGSVALRGELSTTRRGTLLLGVVNGLIGDTLRHEDNPLAMSMSVRVDGRAVPVEPTALAEAFPDAGGRIAVFLHGLMETERGWRLGSGETGETYGSRLRADLGYTSVELRYNTGLHISENGAELADLLTRLCEAWPVPVRQIALIGHSMGGLVARSACHLAQLRGDEWARAVGQVVCLGSPHSGAPLENLVHHLAAVLDAAPETRPISRLLRRRSGGIRDLRAGSLVDEDWRELDPDDLAAVVLAEVPLLVGATHFFVSATLTRNARHPVGRLLGDILVLEHSAAGRGRSRRIAFDAGAHVGGVNHFALLNHPQVYEHLREWLSPDSAKPERARRPLGFLRRAAGR